MEINKRTELVNKGIKKLANLIRTKRTAINNGGRLDCYSQFFPPSFPQPCDLVVCQSEQNILLHQLMMGLAMGLALANGMFVDVLFQ